MLHNRFLSPLAFSCLLLGLLLSGCKKDPDITNLDRELEDALLAASNGQGVSHYLFPESDDYGNIPQDPNNPLSSSKVQLGKFLYHETALSLNPKNVISTGTYSCASCHHAQGGFQSGLAQAISEGGIGFGHKGEGRIRNPLYDLEDLDVQPIRTPSALNIAYQECILWNGQFGATGLNEGTESQWADHTPTQYNALGYQGVETQAFAGLTIHRMMIDSIALAANFIYKSYFDYSFPSRPESERITRETAALAIAAYERTLLANEAPFQRWLKGQTSFMNDAEKRGAILFFGKARCYQCHNGPNLANMEFEAIGMNDLEGPGVYGNGPGIKDRKGRGGFTGNAGDNYKFKVPQLYNLKDSPHYGHGSSFNSIQEVIEYKNRAVPQNQVVPASALSDHFVPLQLTEDEVRDLTWFLENSLYDPNLERYLPQTLPSGNCFPNADAMSLVDLGCQ